MTAAAVLGAELKIEWRSRSGFFAALLFSLLVLLTQAMAFPVRLAARPEVAFAAFFISIFFAALLAENARIFREQKTGVPCLFAISSARPASVFLGKAAATVCLIGLIELFLIPFLIVFYNVPVGLAASSIFFVSGFFLLTNLALAGLLTLFGAATASFKGIANVLALPLLILPMTLPILAIASIGAARGLDGQEFLPHLKLILAADISIWTVGLATYGKLLGRR